MHFDQLDGTPVATAISIASGWYDIELINGSYNVAVTPPAGYVVTSSSPISITVTPGDWRNVNFALVTATPSPAPTDTATPAPTSTFTATPIIGPTSTPVPTATPAIATIDVHINEYLHHPDCTAGQNFNNDFECNNGDAYIEIRSTESSQEDISGWYIKIGSTSWYTMPNNAILPANGKKVIFNDDAGDDTNPLPYSGTVYLYDSSGGLIDSVTLLGVDTAGTAQGYPGDDSGKTWAWLSSPSPGRRNPWQ